MKTPKYLSPTSISLFEKSPEDFYIRYLADNRPPREPQTQAMAVGSAFDARVKSYLHEKLVGKDPKYAYDALFEAQVEAHNRDWAQKAGLVVFHWYKEHGGLSNLLLELEGCIGNPRFEMDLMGTIEGSRESVEGTVQDVPLLGKPDVFFINKEGAYIILDWKVNGYCSPRNTSPMQGYLRCLPGYNQHNNCVPLKYKGIWINQNHFLEDLNVDWARQLTIYAWLCGVPFGEPFVCGIDQLACNPTALTYCIPAGIYGPAIRVAQHRLFVRQKFQQELIRKIHDLWHRITSGHFFQELTKEENDSRCQLLEQSVGQVWDRIQ